MTVEYGKCIYSQTREKDEKEIDQKVVSIDDSIHMRHVHVIRTVYVAAFHCLLLLLLLTVKRQIWTIAPCTISQYVDANFIGKECTIAPSPPHQR